MQKAFGHRISVQFSLVVVVVVVKRTNHHIILKNIQSAVWHSVDLAVWFFISSEVYPHKRNLCQRHVGTMLGNMKSQRQHRQWWKWNMRHKLSSHFKFSSTVSLFLLCDFFSFLHRYCYWQSIRCCGTRVPKCQSATWNCQKYIHKQTTEWFVFIFQKSFFRLSLRNY